MNRMLWVLLCITRSRVEPRVMTKECMTNVRVVAIGTAYDTVVTHAKNDLATANHISDCLILNRNYGYKPQRWQAGRTHVGDD